jgi:hypothetical protein
VRLVECKYSDRSHSLTYLAFTPQELFAGLRRYQRAANASADEAEVEEIVRALMSQDADGDQALDREEFAAAMVNYADAMNTGLHQLIDFMCVVTALGDAS